MQSKRQAKSDRIKWPTTEPGMHKKIREETKTGIKEQNREEMGKQIQWDIFCHLKK